MAVRTLIVRGNSTEVTWLVTALGRIGEKLEITGAIWLGTQAAGTIRQDILNK